MVQPTFSPEQPALFVSDRVLEGAVTHNIRGMGPDAAGLSATVRLAKISHYSPVGAVVLRSPGDRMRDNTPLHQVTYQAVLSADAPTSLGELREIADSSSHPSGPIELLTVPVRDLNEEALRQAVYRQAGRSTARGLTSLSGGGLGLAYAVVEGAITDPNLVRYAAATAIGTAAGYIALTPLYLKGKYRFDRRYSFGNRFPVRVQSAPQWGELST